MNLHQGIKLVVLPCAVAKSGHHGKYVALSITNLDVAIRQLVMIKYLGSLSYEFLPKLSGLHERDARVHAKSEGAVTVAYPCKGKVSQSVHHTSLTHASPIQVPFLNRELGTGIALTNLNKLRSYATCKAIRGVKTL